MSVLLWPYLGQAMAREIQNIPVDYIVSPQGVVETHTPMPHPEGNHRRVCRG